MLEGALCWRTAYSVLDPFLRACAHTFGVHPGRVEVWQCRLITHMLYRFWRLLVDETARPPPPSFLAIVHGPLSREPLGRGRVGVGGERKSTGKEEGRQIGGIEGVDV